MSAGSTNVPYNPYYDLETGVQHPEPESHNANSSSITKKRQNGERRERATSQRLPWEFLHSCNTVYNCHTAD